MRTMNFSGILSRKAGMRAANEASSSKVSNPAAAAKARSYAGMAAATGTDGAPVTVIAETRNVDVIYDEQGRSIREEVSNEQRIVAGMRHDAVDVAPIQEPTPTKADAPKATPKQEATPVPKATTKKATTKKETTKKAAAPKAAAPKTAAPKTAAPKAAAPKAAAPKAEKPRYTMLQYSEKCLALFGDTKPIKEELKKIGGRYNPNLHPFTKDQSVPGWIFANKAKDDLLNLINK